MLTRRNSADAIVIPLTAAVVVAAAVVLNNASPLYYIHVLPALVVPIAPLFTHGARRDGQVDLDGMPRTALGAAALLVWILCASAAVHAMKTVRAVQDLPPGPSSLVDRVRGTVDRNCRVAGDGTLYVPFFSDYPLFVSLQPTEVKHALLYYRGIDEASYWDVKQPDAVFSADPLRPAVAGYVFKHGFVARGDGLWVNPAGCR
jgi:hypothetical protein